MSPEGHGLILPGAQSFVPTAQLPSGSSPFTRRVIYSVCTGSASAQTGFEDANARFGFTWPHTATRMRLRIRNANVNANTFDSTPIAMTGAYIGVPNSAAEAYWQGDFTTAPTSLGLSFAATDIGTTEYVSAWVTPAGQAAGAFMGLSLGFTCSTDSHMTTDGLPGWVFHGATGAGASSAAGNAAVPSGGGITASPYLLPFDIRIEYEYVGRGQIGFYIGTSLTAGLLLRILPPAPQFYGHMGPDNAWPEMVGLRLGHGVSNGGVPSSRTTAWTSETNQCWTRFTDPTSGQLFGASVPDYAVIDHGINDALSTVSLATFQSNIQTIVGLLQTLGINRIIMCTAPIGVLTTGVQNFPTFNNGTLNAALSAGAITSLVVQAVTTTAGSYLTAAPSGPGGGPTSGTGSGAVTSWFNASASANQCWLEFPSSAISEGPLTVTAGTGSTTLTLTVNSFTLQHAHKVGAPVLSTCEGYRQNYNYWMRQLPPGIFSTIDFASIAETSGRGGAPYQKNWMYYTQQDDFHPLSPGLYNAFAQMFTAGLAGL